MSVKRRVVRRVEIEYEDGETIRVTGAWAMKWQEMVESQALCAFVHGVKVPKIEWETVSVSKGGLRRSRKRVSSRSSSSKRVTRGTERTRRDV